MKAVYFSLMTKNGFEICIEPLLYSGAYVATYDNEKNLIGEKTKISLLGAMRLMHLLEKRRGVKFIEKES